jgi:hypothetical protein
MWGAVVGASPSARGGSRRLVGGGIGRLLEE